MNGLRSCRNIPCCCFDLFVSLFLFVEVMVGMGFTTEDIKDALLNQKYNEVTATYLLLGLKTEVIHPHTALKLFSKLFP